MPSLPAFIDICCTIDASSNRGWVGTQADRYEEMCTRFVDTQVDGYEEAL